MTKLKQRRSEDLCKANKTMSQDLVATRETTMVMEITSPLHLFHYLRSNLAAQDQVSIPYGFVEIDQKIVKTYEEFGVWRRQDTAAIAPELLFSVARPDLDTRGQTSVGRDLIEAWVAVLEHSASPFGKRDIGLEYAVRILIGHLRWQRRIQETHLNGVTTFKTSDKSAVKIGAHVDVTVRIGS